MCPICYWEDDLSQLRFVRTLGANDVNLLEAQKNYVRDGVIEPRFQHKVRRPNESDVRDEGWRLIDESVDNIEESIKGFDYGMTYPQDRTNLYYWRKNYWRR